MGIETDRAPGVRIDPNMVAPTNPTVSPIIDDFMKAFRDGFITVDDLKRRQRSEISETSHLKTQVKADDFQRKRIDEAEQLAPGEFDLRKRQQALTGQKLGIDETLTPAQKILAEKEAHDISELADPVKRPAALERKHGEALEEAYVQAFGDLPTKFELDKPAKPVDINKYVESYVNPKLRAEADAFDSGFPPNTVEDNQARAKFYNARHKELLDEAVKSYPDYVKQASVSKETYVRGDERTGKQYQKELQRRLTERLQQNAVQGLQLKAYGTGLESAAKTAGEMPGKVAETESKERAQYLSNQAIQDLRKVAPAYYKIEDAVTGQSTPFKDMSAIFGFMKVLDPGSTVREGEYATAENARAVPDTIRNFYNKVVVGTKLTEEQRVQLKDAAKGALKGQVQGAAPVIEQFLSLEKQTGGKPGNIVPTQDQRLYHELFPNGVTGETKPAATAATAPTAPTDYEALVGKTVQLKDGRKGVVTKNADGTYTLAPVQ